MGEKHSHLGLMIVLAASAALIAPATAAPEQVVVSRGGLGNVISRSVSYADLDLSKVADRKNFKSRVNRVALQICIDLELHNSWGMRGLTAIHEPCVINAREDALAQVPGSPYPGAYRFPDEWD